MDERRGKVSTGRLRLVRQVHVIRTSRTNFDFVRGSRDEKKAKVEGTQQLLRSHATGAIQASERGKSVMAKQ